MSIYLFILKCKCSRSYCICPLFRR